MLVTCLNHHQINNKIMDDKKDIKLLHEYYFSFIVYLKFFLKINYLPNLLIKYLLNNLSNLNLNYNYLIINNRQFKEYLLNLNLNIDSLKQKLLDNSSTNQIIINEKYLISDYLKLKFQDYILNEMLQHLLNLKLSNKTSNRFDNLKLLYIQLIKSNNFDSGLNFGDDEPNKIKIQFVLLQFLNMIYNWKLKKFNYKLTDLSKLEQTNYESNLNRYDCVIFFKRDFDFSILVSSFKQ